MLKKLPLKGVGGCAMSPAAGAPALAAFVPEAKGAPGYVGVWRMDQLGAGGDTPVPIARRTFFRVRIGEGVHRGRKRQCNSQAWAAREARRRDRAMCFSGRGMSGPR